MLLPLYREQNSHLVRACRSHVLSIMPAHVVVSAVRGFHVYHTVWTPSIGEELATTRERRNPHDRFSVAVVQQSAGRRLLQYIARDEFGGGEGACSRTPHSVRLRKTGGGRLLEKGACSRDYTVVSQASVCIAHMACPCHPYIQSLPTLIEALIQVWCVHNLVVPHTT